MPSDANEQLLRDSVTVRAFQRDIGDALCDLAARPLDEAAAHRMQTLIARRAREARAALRRLRSMQQRNASRPVLQLLTMHTDGEVHVAPLSPSRRPVCTAASSGGAA